MTHRLTEWMSAGREARTMNVMNTLMKPEISKLDHKKGRNRPKEGPFCFDLLPPYLPRVGPVSMLSWESWSSSGDLDEKNNNFSDTYDPKSTFLDGFEPLEDNPGSFSQNDLLVKIAF